MYYIEVASYGNSPGGTLSLFYNYQVSPKAWTLMFYIAANNNVDKFLLQERISPFGCQEPECECCGTLG
jgi:hypothetical protein